MQPEATVYVVDDDPAICRLVDELVAPLGLKSRSWSSAEQFLAECRPSGPGCLILDVTMPGMSGLELQRSLPAAGIDLPVIMISAHGDVRMAVDAMRTGASQFLEKPLRVHDLWTSIQEALRLAEQRWHDRRRREANAGKLASLTGAERATFDGLVSGKTNKMIADELQVSVRTIEERRGKLMKKLGVTTRAALVDLAADVPQGSPIHSVCDDRQHDST